jgi:hypothetical protein
MRESSVALSAEEERAFGELVASLMLQERKRHRRVLLLATVMFLGGCGLLVAASNMSSRLAPDGLLLILIFCGSLLMLSGGILKMCSVSPSYWSTKRPAAPL